MSETINRDAFSFNKEGIVQDLLRISYLSTITHLRRIQTPLDSNVKIAGPRKLNTTHGVIYVLLIHQMVVIQVL